MESIRRSSCRPADCLSSASSPASSSFWPRAIFSLTSATSCMQPFIVFLPKIWIKSRWTQNKSAFRTKMLRSSCAHRWRVCGDGSFFAWSVKCLKTSFVARNSNSYLALPDTMSLQARLESGGTFMLTFSFGGACPADLMLVLYPGQAFLSSYGSKPKMVRHSANHSRIDVNWRRRKSRPS